MMISAKRRFKYYFEKVRGTNKHVNVPLSLKFNVTAGPSQHRHSEATTSMGAARTSAGRGGGEIAYPSRFLMLLFNAALCLRVGVVGCEVSQRDRQTQLLHTTPLPLCRGLFDRLRGKTNHLVFPRGSRVCFVEVGGFVCCGGETFHLSVTMSGGGGTSRGGIPVHTTAVHVFATFCLLPKPPKWWKKEICPGSGN